MMIRRSVKVLALGVSVLPIAAAFAGSGQPAPVIITRPAGGEGGTQTVRVANPSAQPAAAVPAWARQGGDLNPDPAARFGVLANGMRYVIYRNATPPGQVAVRLRIDAGDLMEADEQNGLAHFIEHMAFNGTTNIPEGEFVRILERQGLAFGRDTNAFTAPDQTVYQLNIPASTDAKLDTALMVLREVGSEIQFGAEAIERERGIIQSEDRSMYAPARRSFVERDQFLFRGQLLSRRLDIGDLEVIRTAPRERFVDYYQRYYRPERATIVVVGDVDPVAVEARIRSRFDDWRGTGAAGAAPMLGTPAARQFEAGSAIREGALRDVSVSYIRPYVQTADGRADRIARLRERLVLAVLNRRLRRLAQAPNAPFSAASAFSAERYRSAEQTMVSAEARAGQEEAATRILEQEIRRLGQHGVLDAELQREILDQRTQLQAAVAGAATRPSALLADQIVFAINADDVVLAPAQQLALLDQAAQGFDAAGAHTIARRLFTGSGPLLYAISPEPIAGGHARLAQAFSQAAATPVTPPVAVAAKAWPYERFGTPGRVAAREEIADLGTTRVRFDNGVTMLVRPSQAERGRVQVSVRIGGGRLALSPDLVTFPLTQGNSPGASGGFAAGGLGQLSEEEIREALAGRVATTTFGITDDGVLLGGTTRPEDFAVQLQLLTAYLTDPAWRADGFERTRAGLQNLLTGLGSSPLNMALTRYPRLVRSGDARWGLPTREELAAAQLAPLRAAIDPLLDSAPIEVVVVGDVTADEAIRQVSNTFGALPSRAAQAPRRPGLDRVAFARSDAVTRLRHAGRPDVAFGMIAWQTDDFYDDPAETRALQMLRALLQIRGIDKLREEMGATYSPVVLQEASEVFDEFGLVGVGAEVNPAQLDRLMGLIAEVAEEMKTRDVSADELERARAPMLTALANERNTNVYWLTRLSGATWEPRKLETIRTQQAALSAVTPADIRRVAQKYLISGRAFRLAVDPPGGPAATPAS